MMATVLHVTSGLGLKKFQADGFLLTRVYKLAGRIGVAWKMRNIVKVATRHIWGVGDKELNKIVWK